MAVIPSLLSSPTLSNPSKHGVYFSYTSFFLVNTLPTPYFMCMFFTFLTSWPFHSFKYYFIISKKNQTTFYLAFHLAVSLPPGSLSLFPSLHSYTLQKCARLCSAATAGITFSFQYQILNLSVATFTSSLVPSYFGILPPDMLIQNCKQMHVFYSCCKKKKYPTDV